MNVRNVNPQIPLQPTERITRADGDVKTQASADRDANGRQEQAEQETKRHLNDEEFEDCLKALENLPGFQANNLTIRHETTGDKRIVFIEDKEGKIVRRFSESDLWLVTRNLQKNTGHIFDKAA